MLYLDALKGLNEADARYLVENPFGFEECYNARKNISNPELTIPVISRNDLTRTKELARRKQDIADLESLRNIHE